MRQVIDQAAGVAAETQLVFLPGAYDVPEDFARFGFVDRLRRHAPGIDVIAADSNLAYFEQGSLVERLHLDVIGPARARGARRLWLVGISLGGLGAMLYAERYPDVAGVVAIAPYVGTRAALAEVRAAGGLARWRADGSHASAWERRLFGWLQGFARGDARPEFTLAYGRDDRFADSLAYLGAQLPGVAPIVREGGHEWDTWRALWAAVLQERGARIGAGG